MPLNTISQLTYIVVCCVAWPETAAMSVMANPWMRKGKALSFSVRIFVDLFWLWGRGSVRKWVTDTRRQLPFFVLLKQSHLVSLTCSSLLVHVDVFLHVLKPPKRKRRQNLCYIYISKLATVVEGDQEAPFSIATTPRCMGGRYFFLRIAPVYSWYVPYIAEC